MMIRVLACVMTGLAQPGAGTSLPRPEPVAVVELFTSEGCSSCPPADKLLSRLVADAAKGGMRVFPLAFHVDYWDHLGWKDPWASPESTARQRKYATVFAGAGVYTPQMIVNGSDQFVGSDSARAKEAIAAALKAPAAVGVRASASRSGDSVRIRIETGECKDRAGLVVNAALVQRGLSTSVKAGENSGRTLTHDNVVRAFSTGPLSDKPATVDLHAPAGVASADLSVIVYVQDSKSRRISGAAAAPVVAAPAKP